MTNRERAEHAVAKGWEIPEYFDMVKMTNGFYKDPTGRVFSPFEAWELFYIILESHRNTNNASKIPPKENND